MKKRIFSLLLAAIMLVSMLPISALAEEDEAQPEVTETTSTASETEPAPEDEETDTEDTSAESEQPEETQAPEAQTPAEEVPTESEAPAETETPAETEAPADPAEPVAEEPTETEMPTETQEPEEEPVETETPSEEPELPAETPAPETEEPAAEETPATTEAPAETPEPVVEEKPAETEVPVQTEAPVAEEPAEPEITLSLSSLSNVRLVNGAAEFVVTATCNREDVAIRYQWQKLNTKGPYTQIEDAAERAAAREEAWENLGNGTNKLTFQGIEDFSAYEDLLFRCRVTAGDVVVYTREVKLLPEEKAEEPEPTEMPEAQEPAEETPAEDPVAEPEATQEPEALEPETVAEEPAQEPETVPAAETEPEEGSEGAEEPIIQAETVEETPVEEPATEPEEDTAEAEEPAAQSETAAEAPEEAEPAAEPEATPEPETVTEEPSAEPETAAEEPSEKPTTEAEPVPETEAEPEENPEDPEDPTAQEETEDEGYRVEVEPRQIGVPKEDPDKLFQGFVKQQLGRHATRNELKSAGAGNGLTGVGAAIYQIVSPEIHKIAVGERASAEFIIPAEDLGLGQTIRWTAEELGVEQINTEEGFAEAFWERLYTLIDYGNLYSALRADNPYDLYWIDINSGLSYGVRNVYLSQDNDWVEIGAIWIGICVAEPYQNGNEYTMNTTIGSTVVAAGNKARAIVSQYASSSDYEKLRGYCREICNLVEYNYDAANENESGTLSTSDPWQIIWVFDEDPETKVVCEGYAKAFQHLCDLTNFRTGVQCICVVGDAGGAHMWNIVRMEDGLNYLVDVTWSDGTSDSAGFLLQGYDEITEQKPSAYPTYYVEGTARTYDAASMALYGEAKLTLSDHDYAYTPGQVTMTGISMGQLPNKTVYVPGEALDLTGGTVVLQYSDGATEEINLSADSLTVTGFDPSVVGPQSLTVTYGDYTTSFEITIANGKCGDNLYWSFDEATGALTITGSGAMWDFNGNEDEYAPWYEIRDQIQSVSLPTGLTHIGAYAFHFCTNLGQKSIPDSTTSIGEMAFDHCYGLRSLWISASIETIGQSAFTYTGLKEVVFEDGVTRIDESIFGFGTAEEMTVYLPSSITYVGGWVFDHKTVVRYEGTLADKAKLEIGEGNEEAIWKYSYEEQSQMEVTERADAKTVVLDGTNATLPADIFTTGYKPVEVHAGEATVAFDAEAAFAIGAFEQEVQLAIQVTQASETQVNVEINLTAGGANAFAEGTEGSALVTVPFALQEGKLPVVYLVEGETRTQVPVESYTESAVSFRAAHFSEYEVDQVNAITITFMDGENVIGSVTIPEGTAIPPEQIPTPSKEGYILEGWYYVDEGHTYRIEDLTTPFFEGVTLYANWVEATGVTIDESTFPDEQFRMVVGRDIDSDGNGILTAEEIRAAETIVCGESEIGSLQGIQLFTNLKNLYCSDNLLTQLDVSGNTELSTLYCRNNQLTTLDLSKNTLLESLDCGWNQLTVLDLSKQTQLKNLYCDYNYLTKLDLAGKTLDYCAIDQHLPMANLVKVEDTENVFTLDLATIFAADALSGISVRLEDESIPFEYDENTHTVTFLNGIYYELKMICTLATGAEGIGMDVYVPVYYAPPIDQDRVYYDVHYSQQGGWSTNDIEYSSPIEITSVEEMEALLANNRVDVHLYSRPAESDPLYQALLSNKNKLSSFSFYFAGQYTLHISEDEGFMGYFYIDHEDADITIVREGSVDRMNDGIQVFSGKLDYTGDVGRMTLRGRLNGNDTINSSVTIHGNVYDLIWTTNALGEFTPYLGDVFVSGIIDNGVQSGENEIDLDSLNIGRNLGKITTSLPAATFTKEANSTPVQIIEDGVLLRNAEGLTVEDVEFTREDISYISFYGTIERDFQIWRVSVQPDPSKFNADSIESELEDFDIADLWGSAPDSEDHIDVDLTLNGSSYVPTSLTVNGDYRVVYLHGGSYTFESGSVYNVMTIDTPNSPNQFSGWQDTVVSINCSINSMTLQGLLRRTSVVLGENGQVYEGRLQVFDRINRYYTDGRFFFDVPANTTLLENGDLKVMSSDANDRDALGAILANSKTLNASVDGLNADSEAAFMYINQTGSGDLTEDEKAALRSQEANLNMLSAAFQVDVAKVSFDESGNATSAEDVSQLNSEVTFTLELPDDQASYDVFRLHEENGEVSATKLISTEEGDDTVTLSSDRFSKFVVVNTSPVELDFVHPEEKYHHFEYSEGGWLVTEDGTDERLPVSAADAKRLLINDNWFYLSFFEIPSDEERFYSEYTNQLQSVEFVCAGEMTFDISSDAQRLNSITVNRPGANIIVNYPAEDHPYLYVNVYSGSLAFTGDIHSLTLTGNGRDSNADSVVRVNGNVQELTWYGNTAEVDSYNNGDPYLGDLYVTGRIANGEERGRREVDIQNIGIVTVNLTVSSFSKTEEDASLVIEDGELKLVPEYTIGNQLTGANVSLLYQAEYGGTEWTLFIGALSGGEMGSVYLGDEFDASMIMPGENVSVVIWDSPADGTPIRLTGPFNTVDIYAGRVILEESVDSLNISNFWLDQHAVHPVIDVTIDGQVDFLSLEGVNKGTAVKTGANGNVSSGNWHFYLNGLGHLSSPRWFDHSIGANTQIMSNGSLLLMSVDRNGEYGSIASRVDELTQAAGIEEGNQFAAMDIRNGDVYLDETEQALVNEQVPGGRTVTEFDVQVTAYTVDDDGNLTSQSNVSSLTNGEASFALQLPNDDPEAEYRIVRIHDGEAREAQIMEDAVIENGLAQVSSDLFSKFVVVQVGGHAYVAEVNGVKYESFAEAAAAANNGEYMITLLADVEEPYKLSMDNHTVKIQTNGHRLRIETPEWGRLDSAENDGVTSYQLIYGVADPTEDWAGRIFRLAHYNEGWFIQSNENEYFLVTAEQMETIINSGVRTGEVDVFAAPEADDPMWAMLGRHMGAWPDDVTMVDGFNFYCAGDVTLTIPEGAYYFGGFTIENPEANITINRHDTGVANIWVYAGNLTYTGSVEDLRLFGRAYDDHSKDVVVTVNGRIRTLNFMGENAPANDANQAPFKGNLYVNGAIENGYEKGEQTVDLTEYKIGVVTIAMAVKQVENHTTEGTEHIIENGVLKDEYCSKIIENVTKDDLQYYFNGYAGSSMYPNTDKGNWTVIVQHVATEAMSDSIPLGEDFSAVDVQLTPKEYIYNVSLYGSREGDSSLNAPITLPGDFKDVQIHDVDLIVPEGTNYDWLVTHSDFVTADSGLPYSTVTVYGTVQDLNIDGPSDHITIETSGNGKILKGTWTTYNLGNYYNRKTRFFTPGAGILFTNGSLQVLSYDSPDMSDLGAIMPSSATLTAATENVAQNQATYMDITSSSVEELSSQEMTALEGLGIDQNQLAAGFQVEVAKLTFEDDGTITGEEVTELTSEVPITLELPDDENEYQIIRLHEGESGMNADALGEPTTGNVVTVNSDLFSKFLVVRAVKEYTIQFAPGEGSGRMEDVTVETGTEYVLPECAFTAPDGKVFDKWQIGETLYEAGDKITVTEDMVVTAVWKDAILEVSFVHNCEFGNNLAILYAVPVSAMDGYENIHLEAYRKEDLSDTAATIEIEGTQSIKNEPHYVFYYRGIAAKEMGEIVYVKLVAEKDGVRYESHVDEYSIGTFAYNRLEKSTNAKFKRLIVDMLNYGAAAQVYFGHNTGNLVNAQLTAAQRALGTASDPVLTSVERTVINNNKTVTKVQKNVSFASNIDLIYRLTFDQSQSLDAVRMVIKYTTASGGKHEESIPFSRFRSNSNGTYDVYVSSIAAKDLGTEVEAAVYDGENLISDTLYYSIETFVYNRLQKSNSETFKKLIIDAMKYSRSAQNYFSN